MREIVKRFAIVGPGGVTFGSDDDRERAEQYARAIRDRRGIACRVVERPLDQPSSCTPSNLRFSRCGSFPER